MLWKRGNYQYIKLQADAYFKVTCFRNIPWPASSPLLSKLRTRQLHWIMSTDLHILVLYILKHCCGMPSEYMKYIMIYSLCIFLSSKFQVYTKESLSINVDWLSHIRMTCACLYHSQSVHVDPKRMTPRVWYIGRALHLPHIALIKHRACRMWNLV